MGYTSAQVFRTNMDLSFVESHLDNGHWVNKPTLGDYISEDKLVTLSTKGDSFPPLVMN